jgi:4'-phosphopantetheinyl transferase
MKRSLSCPADEVHWQQCNLDESAAELASDVLSPDEVERAARLQRRLDRARFVTSHAWLRGVLSRYLAVSPNAVAFVQSAHGKPSLSAAGADLQFNLSHSGGMAVLAVCRSTAVGIDVEEMRPIDDCDAIARRHFAPAEWRRWAELPAADQLAAFYACWTRKEAYVKALGGGLSVPLDSFEVAFEPGRAAALLSVGGSQRAATHWTLWGLQPQARYAAAVAVPALGLTLRHIDWR